MEAFLPAGLGEGVDDGIPQGQLPPRFGVVWSGLEWFATWQKGLWLSFPLV